MAASATSKVALRPMLADDGPALAALFVASIEELTGDDYSSTQQAAWAAAAEDERSFAARLGALLTLVASIDGIVVGFASLQLPNTIEMLYVAPQSAGQGVAAALCDALERLARARGAEAVAVEASDTAQGFFAKRGFLAVQRSTVICGDEWLGRTAMRKPLDAVPGVPA